jgi:hypothetical protein
MIVSEDGSIVAMPIMTQNTSSVVLLCAGEAVLEFERMLADTVAGTATAAILQQFLQVHTAWLVCKICMTNERLAPAWIPQDCCAQPGMPSKITKWLAFCEPPPALPAWCMPSLMLKCPLTCSCKLSC